MKSSAEFDHYVLPIGSKSTKGNKYNWYKFRIFVKKFNSNSNEIDHVEYQLHPTFPNPNRRVGDEHRCSKYNLDFEGSAGFDMNIVVIFKDGHEEEYTYAINLDKTWPLEELRGVNLSKANLSKTNLSKANLEGANLEEAKLMGANIEGANLKSAKLIKADLRMAKSSDAILEKAELQEAILKDATFFRVNFNHANLQKADLCNAGLIKAKLYGANLSNAKIIGTDLENAFFDKNTNFSGVEYDSKTIDCLRGSNWEEVALMDDHMKKELMERHGKKGIK